MRHCLRSSFVIIKHPLFIYYDQRILIAPYSTCEANKITQHIHLVDTSNWEKLKKYFNGNYGCLWKLHTMENVTWIAHLLTIVFFFVSSHKYLINRIILFKYTIIFVFFYFLWGSWSKNDIENQVESLNSLLLTLVEEKKSFVDL